MEGEKETNRVTVRKIVASTEIYLKKSLKSVGIKLTYLDQIYVYRSGSIKASTEQCFEGIHWSMYSAIVSVQTYNTFLKAL